MTTEQRISEIENNFRQNPLPLDPLDVYVGVGSCADGEMYDIVIANTYEECLALVMKMARSADPNTLNAAELKLQLLNSANYHGRYGTVLGGTVSAVMHNTNGVGNQSCSYTICYRKKKEIKQ